MPLRCGCVALKQVDNDSDSDRWQSSPRLGAAITVNVNYHRFLLLLNGILSTLSDLLRKALPA